jgi:hypothetical protein
MGSSSDRKINYNLRPSKSIERKMILEVLKEVCTPQVAKQYRYIGFGSSFFTDFKLFHRGLNLSDMISIESKKSNEARVKFNKPFSCIKLESGHSKDVLPKLDWKKKFIAWLDYETSLKEYMFEDLETCTNNAKSNSFLLFTLRRDFGDQTKKEFENEFGQNVFTGLKEEDLSPANSATTIRKMFVNKINDILHNAYAAYPADERLVFKQLFDFTYKDEAKMYTFGGIFILAKEEKSFKNYNFNSFDFVNTSNFPYDISFPIITNKEYHTLNDKLPSSRKKFLTNKKIEFIPAEHKESYYNTYKFYPAFIEITDM